MKETIFHNNLKYYFNFEKLFISKFCIIQFQILYYAILIQFHLKLSFKLTKTISWNYYVKNLKNIIFFLKLSCQFYPIIS